MSALIAAEEAGDLPSDAELRSRIITLMSAGQLGNAMAGMDGERGPVADAARGPFAGGDGEPSDAAGVPRIARPEVVLRERTIAAGTCVLPIMGAANRDPQIFDEPDRLDITRKRRPHRTYGGGIHHCLGVGRWSCKRRCGP